MKSAKALAVIAILVFTGCASASKIRELPAGTRADSVRREIGSPSQISWSGGQEVWVYQTAGNSCAVVFEKNRYTVAATACAHGDPDRSATQKSQVARSVANEAATQAAATQAAAMQAQMAAQQSAAAAAQAAQMAGQASMMMMMMPPPMMH